MKNEYSIDLNVKVIFGRGRRNLLHEKLVSFDRKLLICGKHFAASAICRELFADRADYVMHVYEGMEPTLAKTYPLKFT